MRTRTRTKTLSKRVFAKQYTWSSNNGKCSFGSQGLVSTTRPYSRVVETMIDPEPTGGALRPERSCYHSKEEVTLGTGAIRWVYSGTSNYWDGTPEYREDLPTGVTYASTAFTLPDLLADILEKEDPAGQIWQGMPFIGEFKSTVQMVRNPLSFLSKLHVPKGMRQLPLGRVLTNLGLDKGSNAWLQYQYGWAPLMGDLRAVSKGCATMYSQYQRFLAGSGAVTCRRQKSTVVAGAEKITSLGPNAYQRDLTTHLAKCTVAFQVRPARDTERAISYPMFVAKKLGFTPDQILQTAWELTPYSFVADWFIPVGKMLQGTRKLPSNLSIVKTSYHHTCKARQEYWTWNPVWDRGCGIMALPNSKATAVMNWSATKDDYWRNWDGHGPNSSNPATGLTLKRTISALSLIAQRLMCPIRA